ncbi:uncharacterized protein LOC111064905 [Drosophila obscura]|uniref:uncharacterized protein LOC111064905 n=1 Tax=Drosophila obscura TaxID=7282 RepID=UPI001BB1926B|nr:uncharacterized protein LOC111064905 [Drosophila obscura]
MATAAAAAAAQRNILDLPFEVLDLIYKELIYQLDKVNLAKADAYLGEAFAFHSHQQLKTVAPWQYIPRDAWPVLLSLCGTTVREYLCSNSHNWSHPLAKLVERHCPHLEMVDVNVNADNCNSVRSMIANARATIKEIRLDVDNRIKAKIPPMMLHEYPELPQLRKGTFVRFTNEEVFHIQKFSTLVELTLNTGKPDHYQAIKLFEITASLKKLRTLKLFHYNLVESGAAPSMPFPCLEFLQINYCEISTEMPHCPKLTSLDILNCKSSSENVLNRCMLKHGDTLVNLKIDCRPSLCDGEGFLEILRRCKRLRFVYAQAQRVKFTRDFVATMMDILQDNGVTTDEPLHLLIYGRTKVSWLRHWLS